MSVHRITIEVAGDDLVKVTTILEREIENISSRSEKIAAIAEVDEWGFPGHQSEVLNCELSTYDGDRLQFTPPAENRGHYISARSDEYTLPPGRTVRLFYKFVEYKRRNDIVTYGLKHPTRDPEMEISICPGLAYQASFGHHGDVIDLHVGRHVLRGTFLPNHILSVRWWPSRDEQPTAAK